MSKFTFEGDLKGASNTQLDFISATFEKLGFKGSKLQFEPVGKAGDNYIANVKRIICNEDGKTLRMIAKFAPEYPALREGGNIPQLFKNEHHIYTEVLPKFDQKQKSANIPENERFRFANCYGSLNDAPNEIILLEDLSEHNFGILNRYEPLPCETLKLVFKHFAVFHALSYAIRYQEPETYARLSSSLVHPGEEMNEEQLANFMNMFERQALEHTDSKYERYIKGQVLHMHKQDTKIRKILKNSKYTVIQQGDAWTNNILFRTEDNVVKECVLIDYQMARENSPVQDLLNLLFSSTTHEHRSKHFHDYIDHYHNELDNALHNFGLKANLVYPKDRLDADIKTFGKFMFGQSIIVAGVISKSLGEAENMKTLMEGNDILNEAVASEAIKFSHEDSIKMYKTRLEGLVESFIQFGLL